MKLMKEFSFAYKEKFEQAPSYMIIKIMEKYASHHWMIADTYNSLISSFGNRFNSFSNKQVNSFTKSLSEAGLR
jgi:hypothetical protein